MNSGFYLLGLPLLIVLAIGIIFLINYLVGKSKPSRASKPSDHYKQEEPKQPTGNTTHKQKPPDRNYAKIEKEIKEIVKWIGVSEPVNTSLMFEKVLDGKEKEVIDEIAMQLSLPMKVTTKYCPDKKYNEDGSSPLAEVQIGNIPLYGSKHLKDYSCVIKLYPGYNSRPDRFIYVIAHELCHYVLHSLQFQMTDTRKEERLTDLAVIFGGFESAYRTGWRSQATGNAGYYLDENDIMYIRRRYESLLVERRQKFDRISSGYQKLLKEHSDIILFIDRCDTLIKHPKEKIIGDDMTAIGRCLALIDKKDIDSIKKLSASLQSVSKIKRYGTSAEYEQKLAELTKILQGIGLPATDDLSVLMKYTDKYNNN